MPSKIITANRLADGVVVYLDAAERWVEHVGEAAVADDEAARLRLLEIGADAVAAAEIVEPYLIDVSVTPSGPRPVRLREVIRALGPTVYPGQGRSRAQGQGDHVQI